MTHALLLFLLAVAPAASPGSPRAGPERPADVLRPAKVPDFTLPDFRGKEHSLHDHRESRVVVVVFVGSECPLAKLYGPRLAALHEKFREKGVAFLGVNSNRQDNLAKLAHYARIHGIRFPLLKDPGNRVADLFGARRTPEVFVLDKERVVRYRGRIDDRYGVGYARDEVVREHLKIAIEELLRGDEVSRKRVDPVGCFIGRVPEKRAGGKVTYSEHIAPILNERCVECHRDGEIAPFPLTSYEEVAGWEETIREVVEEGRMPPWHASPEHGAFANDARLSDEEKRLIYAWVEGGAPEGDPADLPAPPEFPEGWRISEPDMVLTMPRTFRVPAEGTVPYQYFTVDPGWEEGRWIRAAEARPGNRAVVHHLILFYIEPGNRRPVPDLALPNSIGAMAPGMPPTVFPDGMAKYVPAGSKLVFQVHYTPNGSPATDRSRVGLIFADPGSVRKEIRTRTVANFEFRIPPRAPDHRVEAYHRIRRDSLLLSLFPHMHLRGKSFRFEAFYPDKRREILLDVPRYDFNWQNVYVLEKPLLLPRGTVIRCVARYDNSEENLVNPDPSAAVRWGDQTWEEMMIGTLDVALRSETGGKTHDRREGEQVRPSGDSARSAR